MILNGIGGKTLSHQHVQDSAKLMNETQPHFLSTLVLSFPKGQKRYRIGFPDYEPLNQRELFQELHDFIYLLSLDRTIFRSDHASNWLPLKGTLSKDKNDLLNTLKIAIEQPSMVQLRPDSIRGL